jgi:Xaa-Pro aminopeptidase
VYTLLVNSIKDSGFLSPLRPGHSIGLDILDFWSFTESNNSELKTGMVVAVHPSCMVEIGGDGVGMGYTYLITDNGPVKLSKIDLAAELLSK